MHIFKSFSERRCKLGNFSFWEGPELANNGGNWSIVVTKRRRKQASSYWYICYYWVPQDLSSDKVWRISIFQMSRHSWYLLTLAFKFLLWWHTGKSTLLESDNRNVVKTSRRILSILLKWKEKFRKMEELCKMTIRFVCLLYSARLAF